MPALPSGTIVLWSGAIATIPAGFVLCDGTLGTPDLRDRFVIGAHAGLPPGNIGGAQTHTHSFTGDGHFHTLQSGLNVAPGTNWSDITSTTPAVGTTDPTNHLPPYFSLAYIMKT